MDEKNTLTRCSKQGCCVTGCNNAYYNTNASIKFYNFPSRPWEKERKEIWINSVRRTRLNTNDSWEPKLIHKICSLHFIGNKKSNDPRSPAYNPTIFQQNMKLSNDRNVAKLARYKRMLSRSLAKDQVYSLEPKHSNSRQRPMEMANLRHEVCCQADLIDSNVEEEFTFECTFFASLSEVSTQCHIPLNSINNFRLHYPWFYGFKSLQTDAQINSLTGVLFDGFNMLLLILTENKATHDKWRLNAENKLLMFLMKLKLNLPFYALGRLFHINYKICMPIFVNVLDQLTQDTKSKIFWPDRIVIDATMPKCYAGNFSKCRAVIDCTEIKIQQPKQNEHIRKNHTYSQTKSTFTAKFLIGVTPSGFISFFSKCYRGRIPDTFLTNDCGFLEHLEGKDVILADNGFSGIKCNNVIIVLPHFGHPRSYAEVDEVTTTVTNVRVHVERSIKRIKSFKILDNLPYNLYYKHLDNIVQICCVVSNLQPPIIAENNN